MRLKIETLTPVRIGAGETQEIDGFNSFAVEGKLAVIKPEKLFSSLEDAEKIFKSFEKGLSLNEILSEEEKRKKELWLYQAQFFDSFAEESYKRDKKVKAHILLPDNKLYLPGSSVKGAIRTALLSLLFIEEPSAWWFSRGRLEKNPEKYFRLGGDDPKNDLMKAVQVTDSKGKEVSEAGVVLALKTYLKMRSRRLEPKRGTEEVILAISQGKSFEIEVNINETLIREMARKWDKSGEKVRRILGGFEEEEVLERIFEACNRMTEERIGRDRDFIFSVRNREDFESVLEQLDYLEELTSQEGCVFNLGYGIGRLGTTIQIANQGDKKIERELRKMGKARDYQIKHLNIPWPKTRKLYLKNRLPEGELGWMKMERI